MNLSDLQATAHAMVAPTRGILAADESLGTIEKRLSSIDTEATEENRRAYRDMLFTTPNMEDYISGVIMFWESLEHATGDGTPFPKLLADKGVVPGVKPDRGAKPMAGFPGEKVTEGLDGLRDRLAQFYDFGARFAKWRAVITIGDGIPTAACLKANAEALARYAALCQEQGLVPIVEPEVLMDGDHSIERCAEVTEAALRQVFAALYAHRVALEGTILKPNMVISGKGNAHQAGPEEVAEWTIRVFKRAVPAAVPGIVFLSGGQTEEEATLNLQAINALGDQPWQLSFSYGRALQHSALNAWGGKAENWEAGQAAFFKRAKLNGLARDGKYSPDMETA